MTEHEDDDRCACGLRFVEVPPGHVLTWGFDGSRVCGDIDPEDPPVWLWWGPDLGVKP